jgi:hypothetical protein
MASLIPKFVKKEITDVWVNETWKLMLLKDTYSANASHQFVSDLIPATNEIAASGPYVAGGVACGGGGTPKTSVANGDNYYLDAPDIVIGTGASLNYKFLVLYKVVDAGNPSVNPIRVIIELSTNQVVVNGTSTIQWNALGIIYVS